MARRDYSQEREERKEINEIDLEVHDSGNYDVIYSQVVQHSHLMLDIKVQQ